MEYVMKVKKRNFEALMNGDLTFVIHKVDRLYSAGDRLVLFETDGGNETGRSLTVRITYIMHSEDSLGIKDDYCVVSVKRSGKNTRTNVGNRPASEDEAVEYAAKLGKSADCARRFYNYYAMTGWKMKSGLPLSDWHAALRNWKDFQGSQKPPEQAETDSQLELLLPMLLKKTAGLAKQKEKLVFHDPHIGTVLQFYGFDRLEYPFNAFEVREMVKHYATSKKLGTGCPQMRSPNPYGKGTLQVPTIEEFSAILQKKKEENNVPHDPKEPILKV